MSRSCHGRLVRRSRGWWGVVPGALIRSPRCLLGLACDGYEEVRVIFAGVDWAEAHHDVCVMGDAKVMADLVRTDRHNHRQAAGDSDLAEAVKVLARAHQSAVWSRQRQVNALRSALREYYPGRARGVRHRPGGQ